MFLINCEINPILTWSYNYVICSSTGETKFALRGTKIYVSIVILSTQHNIKLLKQLKSVFKGVTNRKNYQSKVTEKTQNRYLDYLINPSFQ